MVNNYVDNINNRDTAINTCNDNTADNANKEGNVKVDNSYNNITANNPDKANSADNVINC